MPKNLRNNKLIVDNPVLQVDLRNSAFIPLIIRIQGKFQIVIHDANQKIVVKNCTIGLIGVIDYTGDCTVTNKPRTTWIHFTNTQFYCW